MAKPLLFAAADVKFYDQYSKSFYNSAKQCGMECEIVCGGEIERHDASFLRFRLLPEMLETRPCILVLDIDVIIQQPIEIEDCWEVGLYLREDQEFSRMKTLASSFYMTDRAKPFAVDFKKLLEGKKAWMDDQAALYECFLKHRQSYQIKLFDKAFIDVHPGALIWDGKGRVKRSAEFLEAVASYSTIGREIKLYEEPEAANARVSGERDTGPPEDGGGTVGVN